MLGEKDDPYDVLISGAGPAGITAGIVCGRHKLKALILEKESVPSPFPRGETLHAAKIFTDILGSDVLNMIGTHITAARKFNSPFVEHSFEIFRNSPSIVYEWENFMELLLNRLEETAVNIKVNAEVKNGIYQKRSCIGVELGNGERLYAKTILACDGYSSLLGRENGVPYDLINCPTVKRRISNFKGDYQGFEYFLLVPGMLDYAPRFPPSVIFVFPHGEDKCEVGLMIFTPNAVNLSEYCEMPTKDELLRVWHQLITNYPRFSDIMANTTTEFEGVSAIATGQVNRQVMPKIGLILIGGATGFVEASGASGIASSMNQAMFTVEYIADYLKQDWTPALANRFLRELRKEKFWRHVLHNSKKTLRGRKFIFEKLRTAKNINRSWGLIKKFY